MSEQDEQDPAGEKPTKPAPDVVTEKNFEAWLEGQPESVRAMYAEHTSGLKTALSDERSKAKAAAKLQKELDAYKQAEQDRKEAEMSEMDKLKAQADQLKAELAERKQSDLKRTIAAEIGLPEVLAARIQGADEDAMRADAEQLKEALPAQEEPGRAKTKPKITPTNPGSGKETGETPAERRQRIYGGGGDIYDPAQAAAHGGGVIFSPNNE
jgi:alanyl-tRNA synthetase